MDKCISTHLNDEGGGEETGTTKIWILNYGQWFPCSFKTSGPLSRGQSLESAVPERNNACSPLGPHIGMERRGRWNVRFRRLGRPRPQCQRSPVSAERAAALHSFAEVRVGSMTFTFTTARRREDWIWLSWRCLWKNSSAFAWEVWWDLIIWVYLSESCGDMRTPAKHPAIDRHVLRHHFL